MSSHEKSPQHASSTDALAADLAALRADMARLTETMATLAHNQSGHASAAMSESMDKARVVLDEAIAALTQTGRDLADEASGRLRNMGTEVGASIEKNPLTAVMIAAAIGLVIGMLGRDRR